MICYITRTSQRASAPTLSSFVLHYGVCFLCGAGYHLSVVNGCESDKPPIDVSSLSIRQLVDGIDLLAPSDIELSPPRANDDSRLCELIRRGSAEAYAAIQTKLDQQGNLLEQAQRDIQAVAIGDARLHSHILNRIESLEKNLTLVAALRRIRNQPDPIAVEVTIPHETQFMTRRLPAVEVSLRNVDSQKLPIGLRFGGDYRSGRHGRWRVHVWDSNGRLLPVLPAVATDLGGLHVDKQIHFGETWTATLALASYIAIPEPGRYKIQILYHNIATIADARNPTDLQDLIVFQSKPLDVNVQPGPTIEIALAGTATPRVQNLLSELNEQDPVHVVVGDHDESNEDFVIPNSPQEQIAAMQLQAVPALLDAVLEDRMSIRKRAWIFALLFAAIPEPEFDPRRFAAAFPEIEVWGWNDRFVAWQGGGVSFANEDVRIANHVADIEEQQRLAEKWTRFRRKYINIVGREK